jgi:hypothetical protein
MFSVILYMIRQTVGHRAPLLLFPSFSLLLWRFISSQLCCVHYNELYPRLFPFLVLSRWPVKLHIHCEWWLFCRWTRLELTGQICGQNLLKYVSWFLSKCSLNSSSLLQFKCLLGILRWFHMRALEHGFTEMVRKDIFLVPVLETKIFQMFIL